MTIFWIIAAALLLVAVGIIAPSLLRTSGLRELDRNRQNLAIARERLREMEAEHAAGNLPQAEFEAVKVELEEALAEDLSDEASADSVARKPLADRFTAVALVLLLPLAAIPLYLHLGAPQHIDVVGAGAGVTNPNPHAGDDKKLPSIGEMVTALEKRLEENPDDANGWYLLGRTYMSLERYAEAAKAYAKVNALAAEDPTVLLSYADALAMSQGGRISGKPAELVARALELAPDNTTALWLSGTAAEEAGNYREAVAYWRRVEANEQADPQVVSEIRSLIAQAAAKGGFDAGEVAVPGQLPRIASAVPESPAVPNAVPPASENRDAARTAALEVSVDIDPALAGQADPQDTVFVFARAVQGPPMPLAVARHRVADLPVTVTLDDSMAMMPQMKLSNFERVRVTARISKSGNAMPQSGDLVSVDEQVIVAAAAPVRLTIDRVQE
ncbi:MAG: c-type cytochrome biogenesis protein CcmI [Pseudomonadota bacterium]